MSTMITEVYDAFRAAGTPEPEARKAAEALSSAEPRFQGLEAKIDQRFAETDRKIDRLEAKIELRLAEVDRKMDTRFAKVDGDISLLRWMMAFTLATVVTILFLLLRR